MDLKNLAWLCPNHLFGVKGYFLKWAGRGRVIYKCPSCGMTQLFYDPAKQWSRPIRVTSSFRQY